MNEHRCFRRGQGRPLSERSMARDSLRLRYDSMSQVSFLSKKPARGRKHGRDFQSQSFHVARSAGVRHRTAAGDRLFRSIESLRIEKKTTHSCNRRWGTGDLDLQPYDLGALKSLENYPWNSTILDPPRLFVVHLLDVFDPSYDIPPHIPPIDGRIQIFIQQPTNCDILAPYEI